MPLTIKPDIYTPGVYLPDEEQINRIRSAFDKNWNVILWNDNVHTFDEVAYILMQVISINKSQAYKHADAVHNEGKSIVATETQERAELYYEQLISFKLTVSLEKME